MSPSAGRVSGHYAGAFTRFLAFLIDWVLITTIFGVLAQVSVWLIETFFGRVDIEMTGDDRIYAIVGFFVWAFLYITVGLAITGRTPGKALLGLKVVTRSGDPITLGRATGRTLVMPLSFVIFGIGLLGVILGRERRALHDVIAGTAVVYDWGDRAAQMPAPLTRWIERQGVPITPDEATPNDSRSDEAESAEAGEALSAR